RLPRAAPAGAGRAARQPVGRRGAAAPPALPDHPGGTARARRQAHRVELVRPRRAVRAADGDAMSGPAESPDPAPAAPPSPATSSRAGDPGAAASAAAAGAAAAGAAARTAAAADGGGSPGADGSPVEAYLARI